MTFDWYPKKQPHKRVKLRGFDNYKEVDKSKVANALMGMGLCEWEYYMGYVFTQAIAKACELSEDTADITEMFSCDLVGVDKFGEYTQHQEKVVEFLMSKLFDAVSENEEELIVSIKQGVI